MILRSFASGRKWKIFFCLAWLHLRFYRFEPKLLYRIITLRESVDLRVSNQELGFSSVWNIRIAKVFALLGTEYSACMKRCFILALLIADTSEAEIVIGISPKNAHNGHAWLEMDGIVSKESYAAEGGRYVEIKRISLNRESFY